MYGDSNEDPRTGFDRRGADTTYRSALLFPHQFFPLEENHSSHIEHRYPGVGLPETLQVLPDKPSWRGLTYPRLGMPMKITSKGSKGRTHLPYSYEGGLNFPMWDLSERHPPRDSYGRNRATASLGPRNSTGKFVTRAEG
jgi:hypothetical protein